MLGLDRRARATFASMALISLAGIASIDAQAREVREAHEQRAAEKERQPARREAAARHSRPAHPARVQAVHAAENRQPFHERERAVANHPTRPAVRGLSETHPAAGRWNGESARGPGGGPVRVVRYGNAMSGTVEHTIRPGLVSRTFVGGGHVLYTRVYQNHVWHHFGQTFGYETFVPGVRYPAVYYSWALAAWPRPVAYSWGWRGQPWYPMYGVLFAPYPVYMSPDQWMTDYIIAQSMQGAYQAQNAAPAPDASTTAPAVQPSDALPTPQSGDSALEPQTSDTLSAPAAPPPAITPQVKDELYTQIRVQLQEQTAATTPATLTTPGTPPALRPNHVFFEVVQPLQVPTAHGHCSLGANDYIKRTGPMSNDDWMIPVVVELSRPSDCPEGLATRIGLNDLNAMENEQEARVLEAMRAASKSMGPNGPPAGIQPTLIADGSAASDPGALEALQQAR